MQKSTIKTTSYMRFNKICWLVSPLLSLEQNIIWKKILLLSHKQATMYLFEVLNSKNETFIHTSWCLNFSYSVRGIFKLSVKEYEKAGKRLAPLKIMFQNCCKYICSLKEKGRIASGQQSVHTNFADDANNISIKRVKSVQENSNYKR